MKFDLDNGTVEREKRKEGRVICLGAFSSGVGLAVKSRLANVIRRSRQYKKR